jgi:hypothetical protein
MSMTLMAAPALADRPFHFSDARTFFDIDPCSGEEDEITLNFDFSIHEHRNNFVAHVDRSGSTALGYEMIAGTETFVGNKGGERGSFVDQWRHPDGSTFMVHGSFAFNANQGEVLVDRFSITCIGNG